MGKVLRNKNKKSDAWQNIILFVIGALIAAAFFVRFVNITTTFSHYDDTGVAADILYSKESVPKMIDHFEGKTIFFKDENSYQYRIASMIYKTGLMRPLEPVLKIFLPMMTIWFVWSYAPLQFFITGFLINSSQSYQQILFFGRLPSAIFSCLTLIVAYFALRKAMPQKKTPLILAGVLAIIAFSWEAIIYANHMSNYALGLLITTLVLLLLVSYTANNPRKINNPILIGILLAVASYSQYHTFPFIMAFFAAILVYYYPHYKENKTDLLKKLAVMFAVWLILAIPTFALAALRLSPDATAWNQGPNKEYFFSFGAQPTFLSKAYYTIDFMAVNSFKVLQNLILPSHPAGILAGVITITITVMCAAGIISFLRRKPMLSNHVRIFALSSIIFFYSIVVLNRITLSPTRHTLNLLPIVLVLCLEGILFVSLPISTLFKRAHDWKKTADVVASIISVVLLVLILTAFTLNYNTISKERRDKFIESELILLARDNNAEAIVTDSFAPTLMKNLDAQYPVILMGRDELNFTPERMLWLTQQAPLQSPQQYETRFKRLISPAFNSTSSDYELERYWTSRSGVSMDFDNSTDSGYNEVHAYLLFKKS